MKMTTNQDFQSLTLWQEVPEYHTENIGSIEGPSINLHNLQNIWIASKQKLWIKQ